MAMPGTPRSTTETNLGFMCIQCEAGKTQVKDSRQNEDGFIRRRRECGLCGFKFTTVEVPLNVPRTKTDYERYKLVEKSIFPKLVQLADAIDLLKAEHE